MTDEEIRAWLNELGYTFRGMNDTWVVVTTARSVFIWCRCILEASYLSPTSMHPCSVHDDQRHRLLKAIDRKVI